MRRALGAAAIVAASAAALAAASPSTSRAQLAPGVARDRLASADSAFDAGDRRRAEREYAAIVAADPSRSRAVYRLAVLRRAHDRQGAIALFRRYVELEPADPWGWIALGDALADAGDVRGANAAYDAAGRLAPTERDVRVGRARMLARAGHTDAAIDAYERWLVLRPGDVEAARELTRELRRAGRIPVRAAVEPSIAGSRDSDGISTWRTGLTFLSPTVARGRLSATVGSKQARDAAASRGAIDVGVGGTFRPLAQLRLEIAGGVLRADRSRLDTSTAPLPGTGGSGPGRGGTGGRPGAGSGSSEVVPVGRARLLWRVPGDRLRIDARASRMLLDASPYLVAQGVTRQEAGAELDLRVDRSLRVHAFGRAGSVGNADERNARHLVGGAIAFAPATFELSARGQELTYGAPTTLAYFAPRSVRTVELTGYTEREFGGVMVALDGGAGVQRVADWGAAPGPWEPTFRAWGQLVRAMTARAALGVEGEAYDARIGIETPSLAAPAGRWRYGSLRIWLRLGM